MKNAIIVIVLLFAVGAVVVLQRTWQHAENSAQTPGYFQSLGGALRQAQDLSKASHTIDISNQGLTSLPTEFFEGKEQVKIFNVTHNKLTGALPAEIRKMEALEALNASDNQLTGIPAEIGQLAHLKQLNFSNNNIDAYPLEMVNLMDTLELLNLSANNFSQQKQQELRALLPNTQVVF